MLNHKDMTKHIRNRIKHAGIPARVRLYTACGVRCIAADRVAHDAVWTSAQAREISLIADVNGLTSARKTPINLSLDYWSQVKDWRANLVFEFHGA